MNTHTTHCCIAAFASISLGASAGWYLSTDTTDQTDFGSEIVANAHVSAGTDTPAQALRDGQHKKDGSSHPAQHATVFKQRAVARDGGNAEAVPPAASPTKNSTPVSPAAVPQKLVTSEDIDSLHRDAAEGVLRAVRDERKRLAELNEAVDKMMDLWTKSKVGFKFAVRDARFSKFLDDTGREVNRLYFSAKRTAERYEAILDQIEDAFASLDLRDRNSTRIDAALTSQLLDDSRLLAQEHSQAAQEFREYIGRVTRTIEQLFGK